MILGGVATNFVVEGTARLYGAKAKLTYKRDYPVTRNHERQTAFAASVAAEIAGSARVDANAPPTTPRGHTTRTEEET